MNKDAVEGNWYRVNTRGVAHLVSRADIPGAPHNLWMAACGWWFRKFIVPAEGTLLCKSCRKHEGR